MHGKDNITVSQPKDISNTNWLRTQDGSNTLVHPEHGQSYHSLAGAWSECIEVFLKPVLAYAETQAWQEWHVLDVGFGLGLNWLCFVDHARRVGQNLRVDSLENDESLLHLPAPQNLPHWDLIDTTANQGVAPESLALLKKFKINRECVENHVNARLHLADANDTLQRWQSAAVPKFNIILQDAFSAQVNPKLWDDAYFSRLAGVCSPQAILVTYAAASSVQRALKAAGFVVTKCPGFGGKRERLVAIKD